ncbi:leucine--tRNA ligase, partial [Vibrio campbellii]
MYLPTADGLPPLARAKDWKYRNEYEYEYTTMPGWAGSSWYFLRYMSPEDNNALVSPEECKYWNSVDLYMGGSEHATGHLLYARFWSHVLYDLGLISFEEPFYKIFNQGMIQGRSSIVYRVKDNNAFVSKELAHKYDVVKMHVSTNLVDENDKLDIEAFKLWRNDLADSKFIYDGSTFKCDFQIEKMSKSKYN